MKTEERPRPAQGPALPPALTDDEIDVLVEDQCAPANPRLPMLADMQQLMRQAYYGDLA